MSSELKFLATYELRAIVRIRILIIDGTLTGSIKLIMIFKTVYWTLCSLYSFLLLVGGLVVGVCVAPVVVLVALVVQDMALD